MARRPSSTFTQPGQPSFFDTRPAMPLAELDSAIREALGDTLALAKANLGLDRHDIAAEVNRLQPVPERELTKNMLDRFCAPGSGDWQLPAWRIPALCRVTEDYRLLTLLVEACDHKAVPSEAATVAELVMLELEEKRIKDRRNALRKELSPGALEWASQQIGKGDGR
ncbi:hypothetical protein [Mesorhizobium sp. KR1-2]|uniref:hypothetical protein n=1 Tax=Mesorhizobium sp. KR1-2 TaxID=3156609 RepID=UPI0032B54F6D